MTVPTRIHAISGIKDHIGVLLGPSEWVIIDQARIDSFADATGDHQWIHTDPERAKSDSPFGGTVAHGYLTLALLPALLPQILDVESVSMVVNYGIDRVRMPASVPAGTKLRLKAEFKSVREIQGGAARVVMTFSLEIENGLKPACSGDVVYVYYP